MVSFPNAQHKRGAVFQQLGTIPEGHDRNFAVHDFRHLCRELS